MSNTIALPIRKPVAQDYFEHRVFQEYKGRWFERTTKGSLYLCIRQLRLTHLVVERFRFPLNDFYPIQVYPEGWPPEVIADYLKPKGVQLSVMD